MAKPHKYYRSRIEIDTSLPGDRALDLARQAIETQAKVHLTSSAEGRLTAAIKSWAGLSLITFTVSEHSVEGRTKVATAIVDYRTSQMTWAFIPIGPKSMEGYGIYRSYLRALQQVIEAADPSARCIITERDA